MANAANYSGDDPNLVLARRIRKIMDARPELSGDLNLLAQIASRPGTDDDVIRLAGDVSAGSKAQLLIDELRSMPGDKQRGQWKNLPDEQKAVLAQFGYKPPKKKPIWDLGIKAPHSVGDVIGDVVKVATAPVELGVRSVKMGGGVALDAMNVATHETTSAINAATGWAALQGENAVSRVGAPIQRRVGAVLNEATSHPVLNALLAPSGVGIIAEAARQSGIPQGLENSQPYGSQYAAALQVQTREAIQGLERAVANGTLTARQRDRLLARQDGMIPGTKVPHLPDLLDWWDNANDPDMPHDLQTWRAVGGSLGDVWDMSRSGRLFSPSAELAALQKLPDQSTATLMYAKQVAQGKSPEQILRERGLNPNDPDWVARLGDLRDITEKPGFDEAVKVLAGGKLSMGSQVATLMQRDPLTPDGRIVAGGVDVTVMFAADPTLMGGKALSAWREARYLVGANEYKGFMAAAAEYAADPKAWRARALADTGGIADRLVAQAKVLNTEGRLKAYVRGAERISERFAEMEAAAGGPAGGAAIKKLVYSMPNLNGPGFEFLKDTWKKGLWRSPSELLDTFASWESIATAMSGSFARTGDVTAAGRLSFPYLTRRMELTSAAGSMAKRVVELGASFGGGADASIGAKAVQQVVKPVALLARIPTGRQIAVDDMKTYQKLLRFGSMAGWSTEKSDQLLYDYVFAGGPGGTMAARRKIIEATQRDILDSIGLLETGPVTVRKARQQILDRLEAEAYGTDARDLVRQADGSFRAVGMWAQIDSSPNIGLVTYRELAKAAEHNWYGARLYRATHWDWLEQLTGRWKSNVMARGGFGFKFGGEEAAGMTVRETMRAYLNGVAAANGARKSIVEHMDDMARLADKSAPEVAARIREDIEKMRVGWAMRAFTRPLDAMTGHLHDFVSDRPAANVFLRKFDTLAGFTDRAIFKVASEATDFYRSVWAAGVTNPYLTEASLELLGGRYVKPLVAHPDLYEATKDWYRYDPFAAEQTLLEVAGHHATWHSLSQDPARLGQFYLDVPEEISTRRVRSYFESVPRKDARHQTAVVNEFTRIAKSPEYPGIHAALGGAITPAMQDRFLQAAANAPWKGDTAVEVVKSARAQLDDLNVAWTEAIEKFAGIDVDPAVADRVNAALKPVIGRSPRDIVQTIADGKGLTSTGAAVGSNELIAANVAKNRKAGRAAERTIHNAPETMELARIRAWSKAKETVAKLAADHPEAAQLLKVMEQIDGHIEAVNRLGLRESSLLFGSVNPFPVFSRDDLRGRVLEKVRKAHGTERAQQWFDQSERAIAVDGVPVARPLAQGHAAVYLPVLSAEERALWRQAATGEMTAAQFARFQDLPVYYQDAIGALMEGDAAALSTLFGKAGVDGGAAVSTVGVGEYRTAQELHATLSWVLTGEKIKPSDVSQLPVASVHIKLPSGGVWKDWQRGTRLPEVGTLEEDGVRIGRVLGTDGFNVRFDKVKDPAILHPDMTTTINGVVLPGVSREAALEDWAATITDQAMDYFVAPNVYKDGSERVGDPLHEVIHALYDDENPHVIERVSAIPELDLPDTVKALRVEIKGNSKSLWSKAADFGWSFSDGQIQGLARNPMMIHAYARQIETREAFKKVALEYADKWKAGEALADETGAGWAFRQVFDDGGRFKTSMGVDKFYADYEELRKTVEAVRAHEAEQFALAGVKDGRYSVELLPEISRLDAKIALEGLREGHAITEYLAAAAREGAIKQVAPFIHDVRVRTMFSEQFSTIMPFRFAEEQFLTRWAYTLRHSPEAFHRLQLVAGALHTIGFVEEDEYGNKVFNLPVMPAVYHLLTRTPVISGLLATHTSAPLGSGFSFAIENLSPGIENPAHVATSPFLRIVPTVFKHLLPEVSFFQAADLALQGHYRSDLVEAFFPGYQKSIVKAYMMDKDDSEVARATINAMQMMTAEATRLHAKANEARAAGHLDAAAQFEKRASELEPPDEINKVAVEHWISEVKRQARAVILTRAVSQYALPTSGRIVPKVQYTKEFLKILGGTGADGRPITYEEGIARFLAEHPYALPFTIPGSESESGARLDYSEVAVNWLEENRDFARDHSDVAAWFLPPVGAGVSSEAAYAIAAADWKRIKGPEEWLADLKTAEAAPEWIRSQRDRDALLEQYKDDPVMKRQIMAQWYEFSQAYGAAHPMWLQEWNSQARKDKRRQVRESILRLADQGKLPAGEHSDAIVEIVKSYRDYMSVRHSAEMRGQSNKTVAAREDLDRRWRAYVDDFLLRRPTAQAFYDSMIIQDVPDIADVSNQAA